MAYISFQPKDYFNTTLWTGDGNSTQNITGTGFNADWIWLKGRSGAGDHQLYDKVRGVQKMIISNGTNAESTNSIGLQTFGSDGFTMGSDMTGSGSTFVAWNWLANGQGSSNTDGSINTTYTSANTTSGFSISTYTGTGANATVGHGLGVAPKVVLIKQTNGTAWWFMYHNDLGTTGKLNLNTTGYNNDLQASYWNSTAPSSSVFSLGTETSVNGSGQNFVAYCFAEKKGFSKFGSYTGNGSTDGTFVYCGFKPAFVIIKGSSNTENWHMYDNKRDTFNPTDQALQPNASGAEFTETNVLDFLSNGFKLRVSGGGHNGSGVSYIFMAFAEAPLVSSNGVPAVAR